MRSRRRRNAGDRAVEVPGQPRRPRPVSEQARPRRSAAGQPQGPPPSRALPSRGRRTENNRRASPPPPGGTGLMTDGTALYRSILAHPADDTPRLVYADWLEENGRSEEAEFIRVECRLEAILPGEPEYTELIDRREELRLWLTA